MRRNPGFVALDLGGILLTDPTLGTFWTDICQGDVDASARTRTLWFSSLREPFERGEIPETQVWRTLASTAGSRADLVRAAFLDNFVELSHGIDALRACADAGLTPVLATNHYAPWLPIWRERFDWFNLFATVICSSSIGVRKPDRSFFLATLDVCAGTDIGDIPFVDDIPENVAAASAAGFHGVLGDATGTWRWDVLPHDQPE